MVKKITNKREVYKYYIVKRSYLFKMPIAYVVSIKLVDETVTSSCMAAVNCRLLQHVHRCVVLFFWSSGITHNKL